MSIISLVLLMSYLFLKGKYMINKEEWQLIQQTVLRDDAELLQETKLQDYKNVTLAMQFNEKKKVVTKKQKEENEKKKEKLKEGKMNL